MIIKCLLKISISLCVWLVGGSIWTLWVLWVFRTSLSGLWFYSKLQRNACVMATFTCDFFLITSFPNSTVEKKRDRERKKGRKEGGKEVRKERWARVSPHRLWAMFCFLSGNRKESVSTANTEYQTHNITLITTTAKTKMNTSLPPRYHVSDIWPRESLAQEQNEPLQLKLAGAGGEGRGKVWFKGYHTGLKDKDFWALICCIMLRTSLFQFLFYYFQNSMSPCPLPHGGAFQESIQTHTQSL